MLPTVYNHLIDLYAAVFNWFSSVTWPVNGSIQSFLWHHGYKTAMQMDLVRPEMAAVTAVTVTAVVLIRRQLAR